MIDKEAFLKPRLPEATVELDGATVTVRGLSRSEVIGLQPLAKDQEQLEKRILLFGFVDPVLTPDEVDQWYAAAPAGDIDRVIDEISGLSGTSEGANKSGVSEVRGRP